MSRKESNVSTVNCEKCNNNVVPRLWHEDMNSFTSYRRNQHICPICGVTMYETGGGTTPLGYIIYSVVGSVILWGVFAIFWQEMFGLSNSTAATLAWISYFICVGIFMSTKIFKLTLVQLFSKIYLFFKQKLNRSA